MAKQNTTDDQNTDELPIKKVDPPKPTPSTTKDGDFKNVKFAYSQVGEAVIKQAEGVIKLMDQTFGASLMKPKLESVPEMFDELMQGHKPQDYIPILEDFQKRTAHSLDDLLKAKFTYEKSTHKNQNDYTLTCITAGSGLETAKANWHFALSSYREEKQNAEMTLKEAVYAARKTYKEVYNPKDDLESRIDYNVDYLEEATAVAAALEGYGSTMDKANSGLVTAFSALMSAFNKNWNVVADGELKLISSNRKDSKTLWSSIQSYYSKKFGSK